MNQIETGFVNIRKSPGEEPQMPAELMHAKLLAQDARALLADMLRGDGNVSDGDEERAVKIAFSMADAFDKEFQRRMNEAVKNMSRIEKVPPGMKL